ncbi:MAG: DUF1573 domain-containing protein [Clostridiaceae bacterium]|jgi:hypothetical protein|nr:DUF1573 domain-containing protein [Clostridiaceae bacterium]
MKDMLIDEFQYTVQELLFRNKSIIDSITKYQDSNARVNRAIVKAVTQCGCIRIDAKKQKMPEDGSFEEIRKAMDTHIEGSLCENCRDQIEKELGKNLYYIASICNTLDLNLYDIIIKEQDKVKMLGQFSLE